MILLDNINLIRNKFPAIWSMMDSLEQLEKSNIIQLCDTKNGQYTLRSVENGREIYMHSRYNPTEEAQRIIHGYKNIENYEHVMFYGVGLGYQIIAFVEKYPKISFSIYEPNQEIFAKFLGFQKLNSSVFSNLKQIYIERNSNDLHKNLNDFTRLVTSKRVLLISLPSYERVLHDTYKKFSETFKQIIANKRFSVKTNVAFEKRWVLNSLINLPQVIKTPNILHDVSEDHFKNKPALIVSAGPSLEYSIEELRQIKEQGLAYIFSAGSAIDALISQGIYPDGACTYDPTPMNQKVFKKVVDNNLSDIQLIFGSSVGFETVQKYPFSKMHMLTTQDSVAPFFLKRIDGKSLVFVADAPSVAVITLQLLYQFGCNPIILVGQNFAYLNDKHYSKGINHDWRPNAITEMEREQSLEVEDVNGNKVYTSDGFNKMRREMEVYIQRYSDRDIFNTTKGGAKILGAQYIPLEKIIREKLTKKVVCNDWINAKSHYDVQYLRIKLNEMEKEFQDLCKLFQNVIKIFNEINGLLKTNNEQAMEKIFPKFDRIYSLLRKNNFYNVFVLPMNRVEFDLLTTQLREMRFETNIMIKGQKVLLEIGKFIYLCKNAIESLTPIWKTTYDSLINESPI